MQAVKYFDTRWYSTRRLRLVAFFLFVCAAIGLSLVVTLVGLAYALSNDLEPFASMSPTMRVVVVPAVVVAYIWALIRLYGMLLRWYMSKQQKPLLPKKQTQKKEWALTVAMLGFVIAVVSAGLYFITGQEDPDYMLPIIIAVTVVVVLFGLLLGPPKTRSLNNQEGEKHDKHVGS